MLAPTNAGALRLRLSPSRPRVSTRCFLVIAVTTLAAVAAAVAAVAAAAAAVAVGVAAGLVEVKHPQSNSHHLQAAVWLAPSGVVGAGMY